MAEAAKVLPFGRRGESEQAEERRILMEGLTQTKLLMNQAYLSFNSVYDPDLIESCVFEINSLQARYSYLLRKLKELDQAE